MAMIDNPPVGSGQDAAVRGPFSGETRRKTRRILLLTANTGGGHRSSAEATKEALSHLFGDEVDVDIVDAFRGYMPFPVSKMDWIYPRLIQYAELWWKLSWDLLNSPSRSRKFLRLFWHFTKSDILRLFRDNRADLIVSFHPGYNYAIQWAKDAVGAEVPVVTVVTDLLSIHAMWCASGTTFYMLPTQGAVGRCLAFGVPPEIVEVPGLPISLRFRDALRQDKARVREELGLDPKKHVVLLMGGGEGMGMLMEIAEAVEESSPDLQMVVVTGRRENLRKEFENKAWKIPVKIYGFTRDVPLLMRASDTVVTKAGPSTVSEALAMGLPIILSSYIRGQEDGNRAFVEECGAGVYEPDPTRIAGLLRDWFSPAGTKLADMSAAALKNGKPEAALHVARHIFSIMKEKDPGSG